MLALLELILGLGEILLSWRLFLVLALTGTLWYAVVSFVPNETAQWIMCAILGVCGLCAGFYWQKQAGNRT